MATWEKVKFYWQTMLGSSGSTLSATSTLSGTDVNNIYNMLEGDRWEATDATSPQYITLNLGSGQDADYLVILGHNLSTIGATVTLQYSLDNFSADINDAFIGETVSADTVYLKEFTAPGVHQHWRLKLTGQTAAPQMAICIWGLKTTLDYARASFDPNSQEMKANINISGNGYLLGIHRRFTERQMRLAFPDSDSILYAKIKTWWETSRLNNFFVAWEHANNPNDIFLMHPDVKMDNPIKTGAIIENSSPLWGGTNWGSQNWSDTPGISRRDITITLRGRKE